MKEESPITYLRLLFTFVEPLVRRITQKHRHLTSCVCFMRFIHFIDVSILRVNSIYPNHPSVKENTILVPIS